jgi:hypothetical protein
MYNNGKGCGEKYDCEYKDLSVCKNEPKVCKEQHEKKCPVVLAKKAEERARDQDYISFGSAMKCAGCEESTERLGELPERLKARSPLLCTPCRQSFLLMSATAKVCSRGACLCTDDLSVGGTKCPLTGHRDPPTESLFNKELLKDKTRECTQCYRCRNNRKKSETSVKIKATALLTAYSLDERASWKIATGCDGDPVMPELRKEAANEPTYFSSELPPDKWCEAQKLLLNWEQQQHGTFPASLHAMDTFWFKKASFFIDTFSPVPRLYTKEAVVPYILASRLLLKLSLFLKSAADGDAFINADEPKKEEWIKIMKDLDEPLYSTVVEQFWIPWYTDQELLLLPTSLEFE